jgi:acetyl esterase/lipase
MMIKTLIVISLILMTATSKAQKVLPLYEGEIPGAIPGPDLEKSDTIADGILIVSKISRPTIAVYLPDPKIATKIAVIIFPGGGYGINAIKHEGWDVAEYFAKKGVAAFVVKYRLPDSATMIHPDAGPLMDAQQAIIHVRKNAKQYNIDPLKVGVMGFSAGGHLAANASTLFRYHTTPSAVRPDFSILVYPVISLSDSLGHIGSRNNLLGKNPNPETLKLFSNELQVYAKTPPAFLVHAKDDPINYTNSVLYEEALKKYNVPVKLLLYEKGGHGYGMYNKTSDIFWPDEAVKNVMNMLNEKNVKN